MINNVRMTMFFWATYYPFSIEPGGKGSFQAVKLQRPARATVCSHSTKGHGRHAFNLIEDHNNDTQGECLSSCEQ